MQEQNCRLIQDVRDKDKGIYIFTLSIIILPLYLLLAYFTLFQERIKISSLQQSQAKEKEVLESKINHLESQNEAQNKLIRTLEDKDNMVGINVKNMEQELQLRQQVKKPNTASRIRIFSKSYDFPEFGYNRLGLGIAQKKVNRIGPTLPGSKAKRI